MSVSLYTARSNQYPYTTQDNTRILIQRTTRHSSTWSRPILMHICIFFYVLARNMHKDKCWQSQRIPCLHNFATLHREGSRFEAKRWCVLGTSGWSRNLLSGAEPSLPGPRPLRRDRMSGTWRAAPIGPTGSPQKVVHGFQSITGRDGWVKLLQGLGGSWPPLCWVLGAVPSRWANWVERTSWSISSRTKYSVWRSGIATIDQPLRLPVPDDGNVARM